jgi:hypothetical protein
MEFYSEQYLEALQTTPGIMWEAAIPERFAGMSQHEIRSMLMPQVRYSLEDTIEFSGDEAPEAFDWKDTKPECLLVRD